MIGVWDGMNPVSSPSLGWAPPLNGYAMGETWLLVTPSADEIVRLGISDQRGDGRPDYTYNGWVLYADSVQPQRLPLPADPSSSTAWASTLPTPSASAVRKLSSPASPQRDHRDCPRRSIRHPRLRRRRSRRSSDLLRLRHHHRWHQLRLGDRRLAHPQQRTLRHHPPSVPIPFTVTASPPTSLRLADSPSPLRSLAATRHSAAVPPPAPSPRPVTA